MAALLDLPLEVLTNVCQQLDLYGLVRVAAACRRFRYGDDGLETVEVPTESPVVMALRDLSFPGGELVPSTHPAGWSESWISYLARCVRQRRCREAPPIAAGEYQSLFVDAAGRLLACGKGPDVGHGEKEVIVCIAKSVTAMAAVRVRSVAAGAGHNLALCWDGRVFSCGFNCCGQLGQGDRHDRHSHAPVEGLEGVLGVAAAVHHSLAVTRSGAVFSWAQAIVPEAHESLRPVIVEGFEGVRVRDVFAAAGGAFATGEYGKLFSWGAYEDGLLVHGDL
jgi:hypothetical protein